MKAFPDPHIKEESRQGMDLRDWFAGLAMQGLIAHQGENLDLVFTVEAAYEIAEGMMETRNATD